MAADIPKVVEVSVQTKAIANINGNILMQEKCWVEKHQAMAQDINETTTSKQWSNRTTIVVYKPNGFRQRGIATENVLPSDISIMGMESMNPVAND